MLNLNRSMNFIRCSKREYLIKKGSISNYSFIINDEDANGILDFLFEKAQYPISYDELVNVLVDKLGICNKETASTTIDELTELEIFEDINGSANDKKEAFVLVEEPCADMVLSCFSKQGYTVDIRIVGDSADTDSKYPYVAPEYSAILEAAKNYEYVILIYTRFAPGLFYEINRLCIEDGKKLVMAYMDGAEGVIIPLLDVAQVGCYNDFELLRESSFFNLIDYQMMKEHLLTQTDQQVCLSFLHMSILIDNVLLLLDRYRKFSSINYYAYSMDFERLVNTKTRLLKFPKCPSCQGDRNLVHPFI